MQRSTAQRGAIREVFRQSSGPVDAREAHAAARRRVRGLGIATVYRAINDLIEEGWLARVELPGQAPRYERAGKRHHHHFVCNGCDRVFEVDACPGNLRKGVPAGFRLEAHEFVLYGRCSGCAA